MDVEAADGLCRVTSPLLADKIQQPALEADVVRNEDCTVVGCKTRLCDGPAEVWLLWPVPFDGITASAIQRNHGQCRLIHKTDWNRLLM